MAAYGRRISSLLSRSSLKYLLSGTAVPARVLSPGINRFGTAAAVEEPPIRPSVKIDYNQILINGQFLDSASGKTFPTYDPRTEEVIAHVAEGDAEDIDRAVAAARQAFDNGPWRKMTAYERSQIINRCADIVEEHNDEIATLETLDNGKTYEQASTIEIPTVVRILRYYAGWPDKIHGLVVPADGPHHVQIMHEAIGVAGQIIPWNFQIEIGEVEVEDAEADFIGNIRKIDDVIHGIVVRGSAPCWLPFRPGSSYWVPPKRKGQTRGLERLIGRLSNPMNKEEMMSLTISYFPFCTLSQSLDGTAKCKSSSNSVKSNNMVVSLVDT